MSSRSTATTLGVLASWRFPKGLGGWSILGGLPWFICTIEAEDPTAYPAKQVRLLANGKCEVAMGQPSIIVIGAGVAGLSTGIYGRLNGYATTIFEHHALPGGLCTGWQRQGYHINGCVHWLMGSSPGGALHQIWQDLGALDGTSFVYADEYFRLIDKQGRTLIFYSDLNRLESQLKDFSPADSALIDQLLQGARACCGFEIPVDKAPELYTLRDRVRLFLKQIPILPTYRAWKDASIEDVARRFQHPVLADVIRSVFLSDFPAMFMLVTMAALHERSAGYPLGGSLPLARAIERRYLSLGGQVHYRSTVTKILVEQDQAVGVQLADGSIHRADTVVSAADGYTTIFRLLGGQYVDRQVRRHFDQYPVFPSMLLVGLGVNRTFPELPPTVAGIRYQLEEPMTLGNKKQDYLILHVYNHDRSLAPAGKTVVACYGLADYDYWAALREDRPAYEAEKKAVADELLRQLDRRFPGLAQQVETVDVATPATFQRYTRNWKGSIEGWIATRENWREHIPKTLPGLDRFYRVGQWVEIGGGLPPAAFSGRHVIQLLCHRDRREFHN